MNESFATFPLLFPLSRGAEPFAALLPPAGGGIAPYLGVAAHLARHGAVHGIRARGLARNELPDHSVPAMVDRYWELLGTLGRPPLLFGWSLGGALAWELAARFADHGHHPAVVMVDSPAVPESADAQHHAELCDQVVASAGPAFAGYDAGLVKATAQAHVTAVTGYRAERLYHGPALLVACSQENQEHAAAWSRLGPRLRTRYVHCGHFEALNGENLAAVARHIDEFLADSPLPIGKEN